MRFLEKAPTIKADMSFLDLEDSVAPPGEGSSKKAGGLDLIII